MQKITLITVCRNNAATIADTFESVKAQEYPVLEYLVIDGASADGTVDIIQQYNHLITRWVSEPDQGIYHALNKGLAMASGEIVGLLHADDMFAHNQVLHTIARAFRTHQPDATYGDLVYVSHRNPEKIIRYWHAGAFAFEQLKNGWMPPHPTVFVRKKVYDKYGGFNPSYDIAADYELMLRLIGTHRIQLHYVPEVLVKMRMGGASNKSLAHILKKMREDYQAMRQARLGNWATLAMKTLSKVSQFARRQKK